MSAAQKFLTYYRQQLALSGGEAEWRQLISALKRPLPLTFRTSQVHAHAPRIEAALAELRSEYVGQNYMPN